jgi:photosystem II stability/assembly factor-like uncharacterized protein
MLRIVHALSTLFASLAFVSAMARPPAIEWQTQTSGVTVRLRGVSAVSSEVAWASGANGTVLRTTDGGRSWQLRQVPGAYGRDHVWIGTTASRVLRSSDGGRTWRVATTPVATGDATGIFSIAFRDRQHGVIVGGNYRQESEALDNAAFTADGGATWTLVKDHGLSGFRSVVAFLPGAERSLIAIGPSGADLSSDDGHTWVPAEGPGFDTVSFARRGGGGWGAGPLGRISRVTWR